MASPHDVIVTEALTPSQVDGVAEIRRLLNLKGVLVGVIAGNNSNDLRPLILSNQQLFILRLVRDLKKDWQVLSKNLEQHAGTLGYTQFGLKGKRLWYARPYYQNVLLDGQQLFTEWTDEALQSTLVELFNRFISSLKTGLAHGHIWAGNIAVQDQTLVLIDYAASLVINDAASDLAEIQLADIQSLGRVIREFVPLSLIGKLEPFLNNCITAEGSIDQVCATLELALLSITQPGSVVESNTEARSGRLLPKSVRAPANIAESATVTKEIVTNEQFEQRIRKTSSLSSEVVESIRKAVLAEIAAHSATQSQSDLKTEPVPQALSSPAVAVTNTAVKSTEKVSTYYEPDVLAKDSATLNGDNNQNSNDTILKICMLIGLAVVVWLVYERWLNSDRDTQQDTVQNNANESIPYTTYWSSQVPSRMKIVAKQAVAGDSLAELTILQSALKQDNIANVRISILRLAFDSRWENQLTADDRKLALSLGLAELLDEPVTGLPQLDDAHPGVILAAIVNLPLSGDVGVVGQVPVRTLASLSDNFRSAFAELEAGGIANFSEPAARALARIMAGLISPDNLAIFLGDQENLKQVLARLRLLRRNAVSQPGLVEQIVELLSKHTGALGGLWSWFAQDQLSIWEPISTKDRLAILVGLSPDQSLFLSHLADLLSFPEVSVSSSALQSLLTLPQFAKQQATMSYLADQSTQVSRNQLVSLITALADTDPTRKESLIASWFKTEPAPQFIAELLAVRAEIEGGDIFSLEAARYLKEKQWQPNPTLLQLYVKHKELLVRALAYSKMDLNDLEDRKLLEAALKSEPNARLKEQLKLKLEEG